MTRILLVDDDAWLAELEAGVLRQAGYQVTVVPHALAAIEVIDSEPPQLIVLDVLLSGSTAFAFLNELQSHSDTAEVPIILCTNIAEQLSLKQLHMYGVRRIVDKSVMHPEDLVAAVRSVLL